VSLALDLYAPPGGTATRRPLLILLGRRNYHPSFGTNLAAQGIAVAYIDLSEYALPVTPDTGFERTVRHVHDTKAAVRFFRKDAATDNRFGIDPHKILLGGHSAKGATAGIATYLRDPATASADFRRVLAAAGGLEGSSGNAGYESSVAGWVSLAGCLPVADLDWITPSSPPMLVVYGANDRGIPPGTATYSLLFGRTTWAGAIPLYARAKAVGLTASQTYVIKNGDHDSAIDSTNPKLISNIATFVKSVPQRPTS
jgi:acetyl esterase/lipase